MISNMKQMLIAGSLTFCLFSLSSIAQQPEDDDLARRAQWGARFEQMPSAGMRIRTLDDNSALAAAGLTVGDILVRVNGTAIPDSPAWNDLTDALVADKPYTLVARRNNKHLTVQVTFAPVPFENYANIDTTYSQIVSDHGVRQRVIVTKPEQTSAPQPAIFVLQGLSCSSIEYWPGRTSNFVRSLRRLVTNSGMVVMRTEKPGLGDSEGNCSQTDFATELNGYEVALEHLKSLPYVDPDRILVYGSSMGSALAPYFANRFDLNAVISDGTYYRTWFEHMLEIERRIKAYQGNDESTINRLMNEAYIPLYYGMLVQKKSYGDVIDAYPLLGSHNYHQDRHMYGRPVEFYHQMQDFDVAGNWQKLKVPVRIRWGTSDWIMSEADNHMIMETLEKAGHQDAELFIFEGLDHFDTIQPSMEASFRGDPGNWDDRIADQLVEWAIALNSQVNPRTAGPE